MRRIRRLTLAKIRLALEVGIALAVARLVILLVPMPTLAAQLKRWGGTVSTRPNLAAAQLQQLSGYLHTVGRYTPWRSLCLEQALAARWLLWRRGLPTTLHLGVAKQGDQLTAHAWLECDGVLVTGARGMARFTPLVHFGRLPARDTE